jgi:hypothetical protein
MVLQNIKLVIIEHAQMYSLAFMLIFTLNGESYLGLISATAVDIADLNDITHLFFEIMSQSLG